MKKLHVRFEQKKTPGAIEVVIRADERDAQVDELIRSLTRRETVRLIALDREGCSVTLDEEEIVFISADGKNVRIITAHGIFRAKQSLRSMEELLGGSFLRVSRFEIINLKMVHKYDFTIGGTLRIEFENGMETWASRRYIPLIREKLAQEEGYLC